LRSPTAIASACRQSIANRVLFERELGRKIGETDRADRQLAVLFLDLDDFKVINDSLGHQEGDRLLRVAAKRLAHAVRHGDALARFAGDEFVVAAHVESFAVAEAIAERMRSVLGHPVRLGEHEHVLRASIGIAMADSVSEDVADLLRNADSAMYRAKRTGRGVALFDDRMRVAAIERLTLESGLRKALADGHLELHYQPVVDLATTAWTSVEALVRWRDPELGLIAPGRFIPVAEDSGLILEVGAWVLEEACSQLAGWQRRGDAPERGIAVNVSLRQLMSRDFPQQVQSVLRMTGIDPGLLGLEITESVLMDGGDYAEDCVTELRALGVRLILDDFGTGLSSLSRLQELPLDVLKIDRSFIAHLGTDCPSRAIVKAILEMGHALRLEVVAEGVETQAQLDDLRELAPDGLSCHAQGFLLARPAIAHEYVLQARGAELLAAC
jgi:diguanylate cyclase (GGDEF)-like protein